MSGLTSLGTLRILLSATLLWLPLSLHAAGYPPFQELVDASDPWGRLVPPPGIYAGPVLIKTPMTIDGRGEVTIDGGGKGTVVTLRTDGAKLMNLHLTHSGNSHNALDAAVRVRGHFNVIQGNRITNSLFGVDLQQAENNLVNGNRIDSEVLENGMRGDAIRLWYSFDNEITDNVLRNFRDMVVWYSQDNLITGNDARGGRYSLHFMYSLANEVRNNHFVDNAAGIFLMYSDGVSVIDNTILHADEATGIGIGLKESSDIELIGNRILYCSNGLSFDASPYQAGSENHIRGNLIAYNDTGMRFHDDMPGNRIQGNRFQGNITPVAVSGGESAGRHQWQGNFWDDYAGFDRNADGIGDTPYTRYSEADRLWMDAPSVRFFKGTPLMEVLGLLARLVTIDASALLVLDEAPQLYDNGSAVGSALRWDRAEQPVDDAAASAKE